jgi:hypothetical protein
LNELWLTIQRVLVATIKHWIPWIRCWCIFEKKGRLWNGFRDTPGWRKRIVRLTIGFSSSTKIGRARDKGFIKSRNRMCIDLYCEPLFWFSVQHTIETNLKSRERLRLNQSKSLHERGEFGIRKSAQATSLILS